MLLCKIRQIRCRNSKNVHIVHLRKGYHKKLTHTHACTHTISPVNTRVATEAKYQIDFIQFFPGETFTYYQINFFRLLPVYKFDSRILHASESGFYCNCDESERNALEELLYVTHTPVLLLTVIANRSNIPLLQFCKKKVMHKLVYIVKRTLEWFNFSFTSTMLLCKDGGRPPF